MRAVILRFVEAARVPISLAQLAHAFTARSASPYLNTEVLEIFLIEDRNIDVWNKWFAIV